MRSEMERPEESPDDTPDDPTISPREARFVAALLGGSTMAEAAAEVGIGKRQANRWMAERANVRDAYNRARNVGLKIAAERLASVADEAITVLQVLLQDDKPTVRMRAADALLRHAGSFGDRISAAEIEERLERIEEQMRGNE